MPFKPLNAAVAHDWKADRGGTVNSEFHRRYYCARMSQEVFINQATICKAFDVIAGNGLSRIIIIRNAGDNLLNNFHVRRGI